jgi:excisionase family DNA binding protein
MRSRLMVTGRGKMSEAEADELTAGKTADLLRVVRMTVPNLARGGNLLGARVGQHRRFSGEELVDYAHGRRCEASHVFLMP